MIEAGPPPETVVLPPLITNHSLSISALENPICPDGVVAVSNRNDRVLYLDVVGDQFPLDQLIVCAQATYGPKATQNEKMDFKKFIKSFFGK